MTILFLDSFDHYTTINQKWPTVVSNPSIGAGGRNGTNAVILDSNDNIVRGMPTEEKTFVAGFAFYCTAIVGSELIYFRDLTTIQCYIQLYSDGHISFLRSTTVLGSSDPGLISVNTWYFLEAKITIDNSSGAGEIKIDENTVINVSGVDTQTSANDYVNTILLGGPSNTYIDDFYYLNTSGTSPQNDFLGDSRVGAFFPSGAGNSAQWQVTGVANNWDAVNETPPNTTDYVYATGSSLIDTHVMQDMGISNGTIFGVQTILYGRKDDAGSVTVHPSLRIGGANYTGTSANLSDSYSYHFGIEEENPDTNSDWSITGINSLEYGYTRSA